ncbi:DUF3035 domain-containing protein [Sphingomonas morindae]|uniref:DUF3035 domain-containing protein n=1 Tax=Sphingomonas morindae TaxID=1541170 RepID=A0ABY4XC28_9SPHN|nr:DUF3035 domain-containing protein [Sphingomonas morindae]USI74453.1 DUF3035 domain-containing protein [Sphingomonas morindae]
MRKVMAVTGALAAAATLAACANTKASGFGSRSGPNEFAVTRAPPLTMPPDFSLRPPKPGAPRPQEASPSAQALAAMFGGTAKVSPGQQALIDAAGGAPDSGVRSEAGSPGTDVVDKGATTQAILAAPAGSQDAAATAATPQPGTAPAATPQH